MKAKIFTCLDNKVRAYGPPHFAVDATIAKKMHEQFINSDEGKKTVNPADFDLYQIGEFCNETGKITPCDPLHICNLRQLQSFEEPKVKEEIQDKEVRKAIN
jgi:hypothetical protein